MGVTRFMKVSDLYSPLTALLYGALGATIALLAWPHIPGLDWLSLPGLAGLLLLAWLLAPSRTAAFTLAAGYYLAGTRGLPVGAGVFFERHVAAPGFFLWIAAALVLAIPYAALWLPTRLRRPWLVAAVVILLFAIQALPWSGFGLFAWISPYLALASLFPGFGLWAFALGIILVVLASRSVWASSLTVIFLIIGESVFWSPVPAVPAMQGVNTQLGPMPASLIARYYRNEKLAAHLLDHERLNRLTLYPEFVAGVWYTANAWQYRNVVTATKQNHHAVLIGAEQPMPGRSAPYLDSLVLIQDGKPRFLPNEISVPYSMWHPWAFHSALLNLDHPEVVQIKGERFGYLICYESLLLWPGLQIAAQKPITTLLFAANDWWAVHTSIPAIQLESAKLWAKILGAHLVSAVNT